MVTTTLALDKSAVSPLRPPAPPPPRSLGLTAWFLPRCLKTPLETLSLTNCQLTESDLAPLPQCPNVSQLKGLDLSSSSLTGFSLEPLQVLQEKVAATPRDPGLDLCGLTEVHLGAILPAPSLCHQLRTFSVHGNILSAAMDGRPLYHTARQCHLPLELYPAPLESYGAQGAPHLGTFAQVQAEPTEILRDLVLPWTIWLSTSPCPHYGTRYSMIQSPSYVPVLRLPGWVRASLHNCLLGIWKLKSRT